LQTQGYKISSEGKLSLLTGWFKQHKEGHRCYFTDENSYRVEGYKVNRSFRKSKEQLYEEIEKLRIQKNDISLLKDELFETQEVKYYFEVKEQLSCLESKLVSLRRETDELKNLEFLEFKERKLNNG